MTFVEFLFQDSLKSVHFFEETFLLIDIDIKMVLRMFFFFFNNANF